MKKLMFLVGFACVAAFPALASTDKPDANISADKILAAMDAAERSYYYQAFDYTMDAIKPGEKYSWKSYDSSGHIEVGEPIIKNDTVCRTFRELITNRKMYSVSSEGTGCKRVGKDGWCRLKKGDMMSCALEPAGSVPEQVSDAIDDAARKVTNSNTTAQSWWYHWWPF